MTFKHIPLLKLSQVDILTDIYRKCQSYNYLELKLQIHRIIYRSMQTIILLAGIGIITQAFTPIDNFQCDASVVGRKSTTYENSEIQKEDLGWTQIGSNSIPTSISGKSGTFQIIHLQKGNAFKIKSIWNDLAVRVQTYNSSTATEVKLLGVTQHYILVREITNFNFVYALYSLNISQILTNTTLNRIQIPSLVYGKGDGRQGLQFSYLVQIKNQQLYTVFTNLVSTYMFIKNINSSGAFQTEKIIANLRLTVFGGNSVNLYDSATQKYYQDKGLAQFTALPPKRTPAGNAQNDFVQRPIAASTDFGPVLYENIKFYQLAYSNFAVTSYTGTTTIKCSYGWFDQTTRLLAQAYDESGTLIPKIFYNRVSFIFVSTNLFTFARRSKDIFTNKTFAGLTSGSADFLQAKGDFSRAVKVSFDMEKVFVLSNTAIAIYEITGDTANLQNNVVNKISQIKLSDSTVSQINGLSAKFLKLEIKCNCIGTKITTFTCFSENLKCMSSKSVSSTVCTLPYTDSLTLFS